MVLFRSLLGGKLIDGKHPKLIDLKTFLAVQNILNNTPAVGVPKVSRHDDVPLKIFARDEVSGKPFTGYITKGNWYYKIKDAATPVNVSSKYLNGLFVSKLSKYEYDASLQRKLERFMIKGIKKKVADMERESAHLKKTIAEKKGLLEKIELKFINDQISEELYNKHSQQIRSEIQELTKEIDSATISKIGRAHV